MLPKSGTHMLYTGGFRNPGGPNFVGSYGHFNRGSNKRNGYRGPSKNHQGHRRVGQSGSRRGQSPQTRRGRKNSRDHLTVL
uniref:Caprin-1_C domain-containing protein n=1 Tax=Strongyloides papillosus TaxID=174720 RepID=A0A0N5BHL7_STREA